MQSIQPLNSTPDPAIPEVTPTTSDGLAFLLPLAAPAIAYLGRAAVQAIASKRRQKAENETDTREYLQQQNEMLLREILDRSEPK